MKFLDLSKFRNSVALSSGRHASVFSGEGVEFWWLRSYSETDDARAIDWKASLRSGKTLVKTFVPDREIPVWCVIDVSAPMGFWTHGSTRFDKAVSVFELVSASAVWSGNRVWAVAFAGDRLRVLNPTLSHADIRRFVQALRHDFETLPPVATDSFPFATVAEKVRAKSAVFFISDLHPEFPLGIRKILKNSHVFSIRISHPLDFSVPLFWIPVAVGRFFSRAIRNAQKVRETIRPSVPSVEIRVDEDAFLPLNRLLSNPHA